MNIHYCANGYQTIPKIVEHMKTPVRVVRSKRSATHYSIPRVGVQQYDINWAHHYVSGEYVYNSAHIVREFNKLTAREHMQCCGVNTPIAYADRATQWVVRDSVYHYGGQGCRIVDTRVNPPRGGYVHPYVPCVDEYRLHIGHGKLLGYFKKIAPDGASTTIRNFMNGYRFKNLKIKHMSKLVVEQAMRAVAALKFSYGAVDIGVIRGEDGKISEAVVFEVNTSPACEDFTASKYAKYFDWLAQNKPHPVWKYTGFDKVSDVYLKLNSEDDDED